MRRIGILLLCALVGTALADLRKPTENAAKQPAPICAQSMFQCAAGNCIPQIWRCDGDSDCAGGEDEKGCTTSTNTCSANEYRCETVETLSSDRMLEHLRAPGSLFAHHCIPNNWKCDGEFDCTNKDDERGCGEVDVKCNEITQFKCLTTGNQYTSCIPRSWLCDGQTDCSDMSDEKNCTEHTKACDSSEFKCDDGQCIYKSWQCDGDHDCVDQSDEKNCNKSTVCDPLTKFKCDSGNFCILKKWRCDGEPDCPDHSDEKGCSAFKTVHNVTCTDDEFKCRTGSSCINKDWKCDGDVDCPDGSDEDGCTKKECQKNERGCDDGKECIAAELFCNGNYDCHDHSDEKGCPTTTRAPAVDCDEEKEYKCEQTPLVCIPYKSLCLGDTSGPNFCTNKSPCNTNITMCDQKSPNCKCRSMSKTSRVCYCQDGFEVKGGKCVDIDECQIPGKCDQICENLPGSYSCDCYPGYKLSFSSTKKHEADNDGVPSKCRAVGDDALLLLSNRAAIRQYDLATNKYHELINKLESAVAMDFWLQNKTLIWSDVSKEKIMICQLDRHTTSNNQFLDNVNNCVSSNSNLTLIDKDVSTPDGLAVDWVHGLLFWTDTGLDRINVLDLTTRKRRVLFDKDLDEPRAIAVDPATGLIFWTDWGKEARIERAGMDGQHRQKIVSGNTIRWPNGLALDILEQRVYWADAKMKSITSSDYWGKNIRTVLHNHDYLKHPFSLTVFEERVFWTDWDQEGVLAVNKFGKGNDVNVLMRGVAGPMTVRVYHQMAQPNHTNKCQNHNCGVDALCLPKPRYRYSVSQQEKELQELPYACQCETGLTLTLKDDEHVCLADVLNPEASELGGSGFPVLFFLMALVLSFAAVTGFLWYRRRPARPFNALQFDNPIYRRTVADHLDADMDNVGDNSLGAVQLNPSSNGGANGVGSRLVLGGSSPATGDSAAIDFNDPMQYNYNQPFPQKANGNPHA